ncbi:hypothetical protein ABH926_003663 [Catenulispora sp. GP43]|uniref:hypothetical protein n=1 Tax=Catenulispora sp. GP43 TaxID=3156263 RepID=UPI00351778FC
MTNHEPGLYPPVLIRADEAEHIQQEREPAADVPGGALGDRWRGGGQARDFGRRRRRRRGRGRWLWLRLRLRL